jgi:hypothetical protein
METRKRRSGTDGWETFSGRYWQTLANEGGAIVSAILGEQVYATSNGVGYNINHS